MVTMRGALLLGSVTFGLAEIGMAVAPSIFDYIRHTWRVLTRSPRDLALAAADPKFHLLPDGRWPVYVPPSENLAHLEQKLRREMPEASLRKIQLFALPQDPAANTPGLLYLPRSYVVPGGRFNEMYGWDSYFIQ